MGTLQRIKEYIDYKGITNKEFEINVGFSNGAFASQLKRGRTIGVDKLENILSSYPEISPEWLLTGKGEMLKSPAKQEEPTQQVVDPQAEYNSTAHLEEKIAFLQEKIQLLQENKALLEKENKRLTHEIDRLKNQKSPTSSIASSPQKSTGELPSMTPKNTKNTSKSQSNMGKNL
uniref:hypothetical protein n=1 Tax=Ornithobacterium rhinotracheale TaxID=28251 RepID=UPI0039A5F730